MPDRRAYGRGFSLPGPTSQLPLAASRGRRHASFSTRRRRSAAARAFARASRGFPVSSSQQVFTRTRANSTMCAGEDSSWDGCSLIRPGAKACSPFWRLNRDGEKSVQGLAW